MEYKHEIKLQILQFQFWHSKIDQSVTIYVIRIIWPYCIKVNQQQQHFPVSQNHIPSFVSGVFPNLIHFWLIFYNFFIHSWAQPLQFFPFFVTK